MYLGKKIFKMTNHKGKIKFFYKKSKKTLKGISKVVSALKLCILFVLKAQQKKNHPSVKLFQFFSN